jgi:hypothetical protein
MEKNTTSVDAERIKGLGTNNSILNIFSPEQKKSPAAERLSTGKFRIFWDYLEWLGLAEDSNLIILSPSHHYFYDDEDLKEVTTILNLKQLNHIKELRDFLKTINQMLRPDSYFVGSFVDRKHQYSFFSNSIHPDKSMQGEVDPVENGIASRIPILNLIYDFMDSRVNNRNLTKKSVSQLLENSGFGILDMSEINGITCFCARKIS